MLLQNDHQVFLRNEAENEENFTFKWFIVDRKRTLSTHIILCGDIRIEIFESCRAAGG